MQSTNPGNPVLSHLSLPTSDGFFEAQLSGDDLSERISKAEGGQRNEDG